MDDVYTSSIIDTLLFMSVENHVLTNKPLLFYVKPRVVACQTQTGADVEVSRGTVSASCQVSGGRLLRTG